jgi:hypothetical protein
LPKEAITKLVEDNGALYLVSDSVKVGLYRITNYHHLCNDSWTAPPTLRSIELMAFPPESRIRKIDLSAVDGPLTVHLSTLGAASQVILGKAPITILPNSLDDLKSSLRIVLTSTDLPRETCASLHVSKNFTFLVDEPGETTFCRDLVALPHCGVTGSEGDNYWSVSAGLSGAKSIFSRDCLATRHARPRNPAVRGGFSRREIPAARKIRFLDPVNVVPGTFRDDDGIVLIQLPDSGLSASQLRTAGYSGQVIDSEPESHDRAGVLL